MHESSRRRTTFSRFEMHDLRQAVADLYSTRATARERAQRRLRELEFEPRDWVRSGNAFDTYQLERRIAEGAIRVVPPASDVRPPQAVDPHEPPAPVDSDRANADELHVDRPETSAVEIVARALRRAGVDFSRDDDEHLIIRGRRVACAPLNGETSDDVFDRVGMQLERQSLLESIRARLPMRSLEVTTGADTVYGIELRRDDRTVAEVRHTKTLLGGRSPVVGSFINGGGHWSQLTASLAETVARLGKIAASADVTVRGYYEALPPDLNDEHVHRARAATDDLIARRSVVYGHPVDLVAPSTHLRLLPLRRRKGRLEAPFACQIGDAALFAGALVIDRRSDVLALWEFAHNGASVGPHWFAALVGLRELTCVEQIDTPGVRTAHEPRGRPFGLRAAQVRGLDERRFGHRSGLLHGDRLRPTAGTLQIAGNYVAGHRRQLQPGQTASDDAAARATEFGITLGANETWVRPHARGFPPDATLTFTWDEPGLVTQVA